MTRQEDGWPLGLQLLNMRVGLVRNRDVSGSISFSTLVTGSSRSSSSFSSTDSDNETTGSFFGDRGIALGNLIGVNNMLSLSGRATASRQIETIRGRKNYRSKIWFSLCAKACSDSESPNSTPSLRHFLEVERRSANAYRMNRNSIGYEFSELQESRSTLEHNPLFENGRIAAPQIRIQ